MPAAAPGVAGDLLDLVASDGLAGKRWRAGPGVSGLPVWSAFPEALAEAERGRPGYPGSAGGRLKQPRTFPGAIRCVSSTGVVQMLP